MGGLYFYGKTNNLHPLYNKAKVFITCLSFELRNNEKL